MKKMKKRIVAIAVVSVLLLFSAAATIPAKVYDNSYEKAYKSAPVTSGIFNFNGSRLNKTIDLLQGINETINNVTDMIIGFVESILLPVRNAITSILDVVIVVLEQIRDLIIGA